MSSYFIYGYYGFGNYGDDLLLEALLTRIRQHDPDASFVVRAREPVPAFKNDPAVNFFIADEILEDKKRCRYHRFLEYRRALVDAVRRCDVLVMGGGTLFIDKGRFNWSLLFMYEAAQAAKRAGRRVIITGVAIDILAHPTSVWLTRRIFALADFSAVRDALSLAYFQDWPTPPRLSADLAWLVSLPQPPVANPGARPRIGLNFVDYFRISSRSTESHRRYRAALKRLVERHRERFDFVLISLQRGIGLRDDWFADDFRTLCPHGQLFHVMDRTTLSATLAGLYGIVTTRFHLALLAARAGVATCIVDHELKLTSLAQELGLPAVSLSEFIADITTDPIEHLRDWNATTVLKNVTRLCQRAEENFSWMKQ